MSASTITVDKVQPNIATYTTLSSALLQSPIITGGLGLQVIKTADYTILDNDYYSTILVDPSARAINITLPAASSNTNRVITIKVTTKGGNVTVTGTIDGATNMYLNRQYDYAEVVSNGTTWYIKHCCCSYSTGWINNSDWKTRALGSMRITYNNAIGTMIVGELITEETSGNTWIVTADSGVILTCKEATGTGHATTGKHLTGSTSGAVYHVNGSTKNVDSNLIHGLNTSLADTNLIVKLFHSDDKTEAKIHQIDLHYSDYQGVGVGFMGVDANTVAVGSLEPGIYFAYLGNYLRLESQDHYYKLNVLYMK